MGMPKKGNFQKNRRGKRSNEYNLGDLDLKEILELENKDLISRAASEYANWMASEKLKKEDPEIVSISARIKELEDEIKETPEYMAIKEELDAKLEELTDESLARYKEEKKNLLEPYKEDLIRFKGAFKAAMDEINRRKFEGKLVVEGKII
jgi:vacuolar-type H+-ATPase subunit I/STV1